LFPQKLEKQIALMGDNLEVVLTFSNVNCFTENENLCQLYLNFKPLRGKRFKVFFEKYFLRMTLVIL
tara:strand:- start:36 stop:236 length:201 start_codon:yes stop_codon:yes gene_type:complete